MQFLRSFVTEIPVQFLRISIVVNFGIDDGHDEFVAEVPTVITTNVIDDHIDEDHARHIHSTHDDDRAHTYTNQHDIVNKCTNICQHNLAIRYTTRDQYNLVSPLTDHSLDYRYYRYSHHDVYGDDSDRNRRSCIAYLCRSDDNYLDIHGVCIICHGSGGQEVMQWCSLRLGGFGLPHASSPTCGGCWHDGFNQAPCRILVPPWTRTTLSRLPASALTSILGSLPNHALETYIDNIMAFASWCSLMSLPSSCRTAYAAMFVEPGFIFLLPVLNFIFIVACGPMKDRTLSAADCSVAYASVALFLRSVSRPGRVEAPLALRAGLLLNVCHQPGIRGPHCNVLQVGTLEGNVHGPRGPYGHNHYRRPHGGLALTMCMNTSVLDFFLARAFWPSLWSPTLSMSSRSSSLALGRNRSLLIARKAGDRHGLLADCFIASAGRSSCTGPCRSPSTRAVLHDVIVLEPDAHRPVRLVHGVQVIVRTMRTTLTSEFMVVNFLEAGQPAVGHVLPAARPRLRTFDYRTPATATTTLDDYDDHSYATLYHPFHDHSKVHSCRQTNAHDFIYVRRPRITIFGNGLIQLELRHGYWSKSLGIGYSMWTIYGYCGYSLVDARWWITHELVMSMLYYVVPHGPNTPVQTYVLGEGSNTDAPTTTTDGSTTTTATLANVCRRRAPNGGLPYLVRNTQRTRRHIMGTTIGGATSRTTPRGKLPSFAGSTPQLQPAEDPFHYARHHTHQYILVLCYNITHPPTRIHDSARHVRRHAQTCIPTSLMMHGHDMQNKPKKAATTTTTTTTTTNHRHYETIHGPPLPLQSGGGTANGTARPTHMVKVEFPQRRVLLCSGIQQQRSYLCSCIRRFVCEQRRFRLCDTSARH